MTKEIAQSTPTNDTTPPTPSSCAGSELTGAVPQNEAIEQIRSLLRIADEALTRQASLTRTPKQRDEDFDEAVRVHRRAVAILNTLQEKSEVDDSFVEALAPLQVEAADMEILLSEIRFDENERTERIPRVRHVE